MTLEKGAIVRGNWSEIEYEVEHVGKDWVTGRCPTNHYWTGSFSYLGKRKGNEISITDPKRPDDKLIVLKDGEPEVRGNQMTLPL